MADQSQAAGFDVYAPPFVPRALRDINQVPAAIVPSTPVRQIDFPGYVSTFAGSAVLQADAHLTEPRRDDSRPAHGRETTQGDGGYGDGDEVDALTIDNYFASFEDALRHEAEAQEDDCERHALFKHPLRMPARKDPRPGMATLHVPGLREAGTLRVEVGDVVHLRQLRFDRTGSPIFGDMLMGAHGWPSTPDVQHDSVVCAIDRAREELTLRVEWLLPTTMLFNVCFSVQQTRIAALFRASAAAQERLLGPWTDWTRSQLFPVPGDGVLQTTLNQFQVRLALYDPNLNYEQKRVVDTVLAQEYGRIPYLISGPPGTGKTKTLVELTLQLLLAQQTAHLLLCAPSDPASDTLVTRLAKFLKPNELLRLNSPSRSFPEVPENILPFCHVDDDMFGLPPITQMMKYRVVVVACRDAELLVKARLSNTDLHSLQVRLSKTLHPEQDPSPFPLHWTALLCDEAAQATEPEVLLPLMLVAPPAEDKEQDARMPIFVLAGDQNQLGPRTASKLPAIQTSLFERLSQRPLYSSHPLARSKQSGGVMRPLTQAMLPILRPAFTNLIRNYRSHPAILAVPSSLFYFNTLEPQAATTDTLQGWPGWQGRGWPVLFSHHTGKDEIEEDGGGWFNVAEAHLACRYAHSFLRAGLIAPQDICIMSPFRAQVQRLRTIARSPAFRMPEVNIGPLEAFQGLESRLVILCTTRTRTRFLDQDLARGLGVLHEPRRFNVALTRAKEGLVVIGNAAVLQLDPNWAAFLSFCHRNGLCDPPDLEPLTAPVHEMGRLEKQLLHVEELEAEEYDDEDAANDDGGETALEHRSSRVLGRGRDDEETRAQREMQRAERALAALDFHDEQYEDLDEHGSEV
nr:isoform 2 of rna helicase mov10l1 [Quercus suber]